MQLKSSKLEDMADESAWDAGCRPDKLSGMAKVQCQSQQVFSAACSSEINYN